MAQGPYKFNQLSGEEIEDLEQQLEQGIYDLSQQIRERKRERESFAQNHSTPAPLRPSTMFQPPIVSAAKPVTRPRDVPTLQLDQLEGLEAAARLHIFFELVELCSPEDEVRVQIAKSKLSAQLMMLIHNRQTKGRCHTWVEFKEFLQTEFAVDVNVDRAWQDIDDIQYDWAENPQSFVNQYICRYATLETRFPQEKFPNRDKAIKRKIWQGLPKDSRDRIEGYLEEEYPLNKFVDRVEYERHAILTLHAPSVNKVSAKDPKVTVTPSQPSSLPTQPEQAKEKSGEELQVLKEQLKKMEEDMKKLLAATPANNYPTSFLNTPPPSYPHRPPFLNNTPQRPRNPQFTPRGPTEFQARPRQVLYCHCCRSNTHLLPQCPQRPARGACFDCHQQGCRRGEPGCPRRINPNPSV